LYTLGNKCLFLSRVIELGCSLVYIIFALRVVVHLEQKLVHVITTKSLMLTLRGILNQN